MKSALNLFKKSLKYPVLWVGLIYLSWWLLTFTNETFRDGLRILIVYFIITILETLLLLSKNKILTVALFVVLLCFMLLSCMLALMEGRWLSDAPSYRRHLIYLPIIIIFSGFKAYELLKSSLSSNKRLHILLFIAMLPVVAINIAYPISFFPEILDKKDFRGFKYYIVWQYDIDYRSYISFYKCKHWKFECNYLPTTLGVHVDMIIIDKERNEISAVNNNTGFGYTDSDNPRIYEGFSAQLGDHVYQLAINAPEYLNCKASSCDSYTYTLYKCNLDYTSCDPLPVKYSATDYDYGWVYLEVNETTKEINAYTRDDNLIFTYGSHPVCYVDKCVILAP